MPETASLSFTRPPGFRELSAREFAAQILERVSAVEEATAVERRRTGASVFGRRAVLDQRPTDRPGGREPRRELNPRVAARGKWSRIEALMRNRAFREAYAAAREAFIAGARDVIFPAGTYWLRRFTRAICEPFPAPA